MHKTIQGGYSDVPNSTTVGIVKQATNIAGGALGTTFAQSAANTTAEVAPNTSTTKKVYKMTGTGSAGAAPVWEQASVIEASDYEVGTWSPTFAGVDTAGTYTPSGSTFFTYIKIGKQVTVRFQVPSFSTASGGAGNLVISNLPYTKATNTTGLGSVLVANIAYASATVVLGWRSATLSQLYIYFQNTAAALNVCPITAVGTTSSVWGQITYETT